MMTTDVLLTPDGLSKLKHELEELKTKGRQAVMARLKAAKEYGDLSENAEYDDARNEQSFVEGRIQELEAMIQKARVIQHTKSSVVELGSTVVVEIEGEKETYTIVGATETDPSAGRISVESPFGRALMGKKAGDVAIVAAPAGELKYKILRVE